MSGPLPSDDRRDGAPSARTSPQVEARERAVTSSPVPDSANPDVVLIGAGIMSATLAELLAVVAPQWHVTVFEAGPEVAAESSDGWNNAGTGHAALCELNYT